LILFQDIKGVIRLRNSKDRQSIGHKKEDKRTSNDLENITQETDDQGTSTSL